MVDAIMKDGVEFWQFDEYNRAVSHKQCYSKFAAKHDRINS